MKSMKINVLNWDSAFFNKKIGDVFFESPSVIENVENFNLIVTKQVLDFNFEISGFHQTFQETKVIFEKALNAKSDNYFSSIRDTDNNPKNIEDFLELAYTSGNFSRFLLDKNFGEENFKKLYREWVVNSLNKKFAIKIFYIEEDNQPIGFVTLQQSGNIGKIGLIATSPEQQGKGLGKKLLQFSENYCIENGMTTMEIPTQKENEQACQFYKKMGYTIKEELIIKHFWK